MADVADKVKIKGRIVLNLHAKEHAALNEATDLKFPNPIVLEPGEYSVSNQPGRFNLHPAIAEHWYVRAHVEGGKPMPAHVATAPHSNGDPKAAEAAQLRARTETGDGDQEAAEAAQLRARTETGDGDQEAEVDETDTEIEAKSVDEMNDVELAAHVRVVTGKQPSRKATRAQLLAMLPLPESE